MAIAPDQSGKDEAAITYIAYMGCSARQDRISNQPDEAAYRELEPV